MSNKEVDPKLSGLVILIVGMTALAYGAFVIDWSVVDWSFKAVFFPVLFLFIVSLFAFKVVSTKDINITTQETDNNISDAIDRFNDKTRVIQNVIAISILFGGLVFLLVVSQWPHLLR